MRSEYTLGLLSRRIGRVVLLWAVLTIGSWSQGQAQHLTRIWENSIVSASTDELIQDQAVFGLEAEDDLNLLENINDNLGWTHRRYQQIHQGFPVEGTQLVFHEKDHQVEVFNGALALGIQGTNTVALNEEEALNMALNSINASVYAWESTTYESSIAILTGDSEATLYPTGTLVWVATAQDNPTYKLAYRFDIYALEPLSRKFYYIDANSGLLLNATDRMALNCFEKEEKQPHNHHDFLKNNNTNLSNDVSATGLSSYVQANSGTVDFTADFDGTGYILKANHLGNAGNQAVHTMNLNNSTGSTLIDFVDTDNYWDSDPIAISVHWGTTQAYDYFSETHGRESFDNQGSTLLSRVHYGQNYVNAFWDGMQMTYGDGDGTSYGALTSLDVIAHELTHGVTQFNGTGGLIYYGESGALNESFSDIFGAVVEFVKHPDGGDWLMGEDFDLVNQVGFRNMENPLLKGHPKNYFGTNWYSGIFDNGGVHSNSGVQNHWFYLLVTGGSGTNEFGVNYNITGIGLEDAAAIAYRNLTTYLTPSATYLDARAGAIQAAEDLFGVGSAQQIATTEAWCAVGVGSSCQPEISTVAPIMSEILTAGTTYTVQWTSHLLSSSSFIKIEYTTDSSAEPVWKLITETASNTGTYDWFVENAPSTTVRIRISDGGESGVNRPANPNVFDITEMFTIESCLGDSTFDFPTLNQPNENIDFIGTVTGTSYEWQIDGNSVATTKDFSYGFSEVGTYEITYIVENGNTCTSIETQTVHVLPENSNGFTAKIGQHSSRVAYNQDVIQMKNGHYSFIAYPPVVFHLDHHGNQIWQSNLLPFPDFTEAKAALLEKDNGNILVAYSSSSSHTGSTFNNLGLLELDATNGSVVNNATNIFSSTGHLYPHLMIKTANGFLIGGEIKRNNQKDIFVIEIDQNNTILHQAFFGNATGDELFSDFISTMDGGFLLTGIYLLNYPNAIMTIKLDQNLQQEWMNAYTTQYNGFYGFGHDSEGKIVELPDCEGYFILAKTGNLGSSYLLKIDRGGILEFGKRYQTNNQYDAVYGFADGIWDAQSGLTILGNYWSEAVQTPGFNLIYDMDYGLLNLDVEGNINWERTLPNLEANFTYPWYDTKLLNTADGGFLASIPGVWGYGTETNLVKTDALGLEICNTISNNTTTIEDISYAMQARDDLQIIINNPPTIQFQSNTTINTSPYNMPYESLCGGYAISPVIASFEVDRYIIETGQSVNIHNNSVGATTFVWKLNGQITTLPLPVFTTSGLYDITLEATDGLNTSTLTKKIHVKTEDCSTCRMSDSLALVALYNSTNGANWTNTWDLNQPMSTWYGVSLNSSGCVICITLGGTEDCTADYGNGNNLVGTIPSELGGLSELRQLWLGNNQLSGDIPLELGNLTELRTLALYNNDLSGAIPASMGNLLNLTQLFLQNNDLTGNIPIELGDLTNMQRMDLSSNQLTGTIPLRLGNLNQLNNLNLSNNQLTGNIPTTFGQLTNLRWLYLSSNQLSGTIPSQLSGMTNLQWLVLNNNQLTGVIPNEMGLMSNLRLIQISSNQLTGNIPVTLGNLSNLRYLFLDNNDLTGVIPNSLGNLNQLNFLSLAYNQLSGNIPTTLGNLSNLNSLIIHHNALTGELPEALGNLTNLGAIYLNNNQLEGCFPESYRDFCNIYYDFSNNPLLFEGGDFDLFCMEEGCITIPVEQVHLLLGDVCGSPNTSVSLPVSVLYFDAISNVQFSLHIDPTVAQITGLSNFGINGLDATDFTINVAQGLITANWTANNVSLGESLANNAVLFEINLQLTGNLGGSTTAYFDNIPTPLHIETTGSPISLTTSTATVCVSNGFALSGAITTPHGLPLINATLYTHGWNVSSMDVQGSHIFELESIEVGTFLSLEPHKSDDPQQGVNASDAAAIKAHIRAVNPFNDPYRVIAGDVDDSQHVSVLDAIHIKRLLQGETTAFPSEDTWKFVPASHEFIDDNQPFPYPKNLVYPAIYQSYSQQNFIGVKVGDVE